MFLLLLPFFELLFYLRLHLIQAGKGDLVAELFDRFVGVARTEGQGLRIFIPNRGNVCDLGQHRIAVKREPYVRVDFCLFIELFGLLPHIVLIGGHQIGQKLIADHKLRDIITTTVSLHPLGIVRVFGIIPAFKAVT